LNLSDDAMTTLKEVQYVYEDLLAMAITNLERIHEQGVLHGDISLESMFIVGDKESVQWGNFTQSSLSTCPEELEAETDAPLELLNVAFQFTSEHDTAVVVW
jgi:hypothetical protein